MQGNNTSIPTPIEKLRKRHIRNLKGLADEQNVFEPIQRGAVNVERNFIPSPNSSDNEIYNHITQFTLRMIKKHNVSEAEFVYLAQVYVHSVYTLFNHVYQHYVNLITNRQNGIDGVGSWETGSLFPEWTDLYVRVCLSRVWTWDFNEQIVFTTWGSPKEIGMPYFEAPMYQHLQPHYIQFCQKAESSLYPVLLSRHIHPHVFMDYSAIGQVVPFNINVHKRINSSLNENDCVTIIIPCVQVNFQFVHTALVFSHTSPSACERIVWPLWGCEFYHFDTDEEDDIVEHDGDSQTVVVNRIFPVCDSRLIEQLSVQPLTRSLLEI